MQSENGFQLSTLKWPSDKFFLLRLHSRCAPMYGKCRLLSKNFWIKSAYDVTDSRSMTSYADSIYLWKVHDIFRALEPIESKQPFYTTLPSTIRGVFTALFSKLLSDQLYGKIVEFLNVLNSVTFPFLKIISVLKEKKTWISNSYLIRQSLWYQIVNKWRVTLK